MKEKIIKTDKATLLVVELPGTVEVSDIRSIEAMHSCKIVNRIPDITDEDAKLIVDEPVVIVDDENNNDIICVKYIQYCDTLIPSMTCYAPITSLESLYSLLQANEVCFENSLGREPDSKDDFYRDALGITSNYWSDLLEWQESQSKVWDRERTYILIKVD